MVILSARWADSKHHVRRRILSDFDDNFMAEKPEERGIGKVFIEAEMKKSYLDYAMSVIVSRAIPDVRDGLKPVHRRILFAMQEAGYSFDKSYRKSARVVGDVIGKYHPHGDSAVYDALVRMAQDFSMRLPLIEGQGNFGSIDGDPPAAMRYTEVRMEKVTNALLDDLGFETVSFQPNYDNQEEEPTVLPARFPNLLVNGANGIAVGMATNIPPHNLGEVLEACLALLHRPEMSDDELLDIVPGPDFPTSGLILGETRTREALREGRGSVLMRGVADIEVGDRNRIIITEIPYQVNKASLVEKIADLVREKKVEGITDLRDESDRHGIRIVVELRRDAEAEVVLNQIYRFTPLQTTFSYNIIALDHGRPRSMGLKDVLQSFLAFREEVVVRRSRYQLAKARDRAHLLVGLVIAVSFVDEVVAMIRGASDPAMAREQLCAREWPAEKIRPYLALIDGDEGARAETIKLTEIQARAILDLRLQRLTAMGVEEISEELNRIAEDIRKILKILTQRPELIRIIEEEFVQIRDEFATPRKTKIVVGGDMLDDEDLIQREDMVVTITHGGYIKRVPSDTYRAQRRGGKGLAGLSMHDEDFVTKLIAADTHTPLIFFTSDGMAFAQKVWRLPLASRTAKGKAIVNLLPIQADVTIAAVLPLDIDAEDRDRYSIVFVTERGNIRRNKLTDFGNLRANGKIAMRLGDNDRLVSVRICSDDDHIMLSTKKGQAIRFPATAVRIFSGTSSTGVRGVNLADADQVVSASILNGLRIDAPEAASYLRLANAMRRGEGEVDFDEDANLANQDGDVAISQDRYAQLGANEEMILAITEDGFGKRTSSYAYRTTNRGGKGIKAMELSSRGDLAGVFSVSEADQMMMVTNMGQMIRIKASDVSIQGRGATGVRIFHVDENEFVVSVTRLAEAPETEEMESEEVEGRDDDLPENGADNDGAGA